jgi:hypothetical protein
MALIKIPDIIGEGALWSQDTSSKGSIIVFGGTFLVFFGSIIVFGGTSLIVFGGTFLNSSVFYQFRYRKTLQGILGRQADRVIKH